MSANWPLHLLSDFITIKHGFAFKGQYIVEQETSDFLVTPGSFAIGGGFKADKRKYYQGPVPDDYVLHPGDLIVTMTDLSKQADTLGYSALVPDIPGIRLLHNQRIGLVQIKNENLHLGYLYFLLRSREYRHHVVSTATGSTVKHTSPSKITSYAFRLPPLSVQKAIADNLLAFEQKNHTNQQISQTLEKMAQAIFKSWFVDFEPAKAKIAAFEAGGREEDALIAAMQAISGKDAEQLATMQAEQPEQYAELRATAELFPSAMQDSELGEIPSGWSIGNVGQLANAKGGFAFKSKQFSDVGFPVLKIKNITGKGTVNLNDCQCIDSATASLASRFKLLDGDLVMAMTGATVGKTGLVVSSGKDIYLNQRVAKFESNKFGSEIGYFLFCLFKKKSTFDELIGAAQGSAQPNISSSGIEMTRLVVPEDELVIRFIKTCRPMFSLWVNNERENLKLSDLRDTVLPKLLSGELEI